MTTPSRTAMEQAELLQDLVERFLAGSLWSLEERKDARILVGLLNDHSRAEEVASGMNTLERKLWDDRNEDSIRRYGPSEQA